MKAQQNGAPWLLLPIFTVRDHLQSLKMYQPYYSRYYFSHLLIDFSSRSLLYNYYYHLSQPKKLLGPNYEIHQLGGLCLTWDK